MGIKTENLGPFRFALNALKNLPTTWGLRLFQRITEECSQIL